MASHRFSLAALVVFLLFGAVAALASITGSISGIVTDPSGGVLVGADIAAVNTQTNMRTTLKTDSRGFYSFPSLPIGTYDLEVSMTGFRAYRQSGMVVDANSALRADVSLEIGQAAEAITVRSEVAHVETDSTQMGEVIDGSRMTTVPLNGRAFTDLLSLQPGVVPASYASQVQKQFGGLTDREVSGDLNPGNQSVNGQRQAANGFMVNGANVEEGKNNGAAIVPNLDSIAEFRIITNNFDAEYGNFSGGQVNVATKSGTNAVHGTAFEFLRNTAFDARNYFNPPPAPKGALRQNQFGATLGAPIKRDKAFFFVDYQGTRLTEGQVLNNAVPSLAERPDTPANVGTANISDLASVLAAASASSLPNFVANGGLGTGLVQQSTASGTGGWADVLTARLGYQVLPGEPYYQTGCSSTNWSPGAPATGCVFPTLTIPHGAFSTAALKLLEFIPRPNNGANFSSASNNNRLRDDKGGVRADFETRFGTLSAYYFLDDFLLNDAFPNSTQLGGPVSAPGFDSVTPGRAQLMNLGDTKTFGSTAVNEFHISFVRVAGSYFKPKGGLRVSLNSLGFPTPSGTGAQFNGGLGPIDPTLEGVPQITLFQQGAGLSIGVPQDTQNAYNNTYQVLDNFTKVFGTHSLKFGGQFHYDQINERNLFGENGSFGFNGGESGSDFVDFLLGAPDNVSQASKQLLDSRSKYAGLFIQDSWRARSSLTLNLGLRWEFSQPWYDTQGKIETIIPGAHSVLYPGAPQGLVVPGDPGVPSTLAPTQYNAFSPRLGLAYSPRAQGGLLGKLTGGPGKASIRMGYGIYYSSVEDLSQFLGVGDAPFGLFYGSPAPPLLDRPFIDRGTGNNEGQKFPFALPPANVSAKHPDTTFNWAQVEPIISSFFYDAKNRMPYSEHYDLSFERQFGASTVLSLSYVGNQGHKLVTSEEANPGNPSLCVFLSQASNLDTGSPVCGPNNETPSSPFVLKPGAGYPRGATPIVETTTPCLSNGALGCNAISSTRTVFGGAAFGTNPFVITAAKSAYNSLQSSLKHTGTWGEFLVGYTYGKCMDNGSALQDATNVFNPRLSRSLCAFDVMHNFVASYSARLPFEKLFHLTSGWTSKIAGGWQVSGITTYATGIPVTIMEQNTTDQSLIGSSGFGWNVDQPNLLPGHVLNNTNPRTQRFDSNGNILNPYFSTSLFVAEGCPNAACTSGQAIGAVGNANRRFFHGPGINNYDMALLKNFSFTESKMLEMRFEAFNIFNHAQFQNPGGTFNSSGFGVVNVANPPRLVQFAMKLRF
jgi:hypothetical protein